MKSVMAAMPALLTALLIVVGCGKDGVRNATSPGKPLKRAVTNDYSGVQVVDEYQWMENAADPDVQGWIAAQGAAARAHLGKLEARPIFEDQLNRMLSASTPDFISPVWRGGRLFLLRVRPPARVPVLVSLRSPNDLKDEKLVLAPGKISPEARIDCFVPSPDGRFVAVSVSEKTGAVGALHVVEAATGELRSDRIPSASAPTPSGNMAWNAQASGLYYTRLGTNAPRFPQIWFHTLGTPVEQDTYEYGREFPGDSSVRLESSPDGRYLLARVALGDGRGTAHHLRDAQGIWREIARPEDQVTQIEFGRDPLYLELGRADSLYLLSTRNAPRGQILRIPLRQPDIALARTNIIQTADPIAEFKPTASGMALVYLRGTSSFFVYRDFLNDQLDGPGRAEGGDGGTPTTVSGLSVARGDEVLFRRESYTDPFVWSRFDPNKDPRTVEITALKGTSPVPFTDIEVVRVNVKARDGASVPLVLIKKKGTRLAGDNPTLLRGAGGSEPTSRPGFDPARRVWFDQGGVLAIVHLGGTGESRQAPYSTGGLTNLQRQFDALAACADWLVRSNYTRPGRLAVEGAGLLVGAMVTQHAEAVRAVVAHGGVYDLMRNEVAAGDAFVSPGQMPNADQARTRLALSPYHHVQEGTNQPAVLMLGGDSEELSNPSQSRKMVARLQAAMVSRRPVLLHPDLAGALDAGNSWERRVRNLADSYSFLLTELGVEITQVERGPLSGGITSTSATVKGKVRREGLSVRLAWSRSEDLRSPAFTPPAVSETNHNNVVSFTLGNLGPDAEYHYALEVDGRLDRRTRGSFRTFPSPGPASFEIAFASCGRTGSTRDVYDRIREHHPLFYLNMGDLHYEDIKSNSVALFRAAYDQVLASPQQGDLYRAVPLVYMWDDHDYGGNDATKKSKTHVAARTTYDEYLPHYPFTDTNVREPIYQSFAVGRVKFIVTDLRSDRDEPRSKDTPQKSMMGVAQKKWFKEELLAANGRYPLICWVSSVPWIGDKGTSPYAHLKPDVFGYIHHSQSNLFKLPATRNTGGEEDHWSAYTHERREIADFIRDRRISGLCILHGDSHMMAADDGSHSDYATGGGAPIPVMCAGPLDQSPSLKGGPYSQGVYRVRDRESGFGLLRITDQGAGIDVTYSGRNNRDEEVISLRFSVPARPNP